MKGKSLPEPYGEVRFADSQNGWFNGGIPAKSLFQTRDGGASWQQVEVYTDDSNVAKGIVRAWFELPVCADHQRGFLPVRYNGGNSNTAPGYLVYFGTRDGGNTWTEISSVDDVDLVYPIAVLPSGELFITDVVRYGNRNEPWKPELSKIRVRKFLAPGSDTEPETVMLESMPWPQPLPRDLKFFDRLNGYLLTSRSLLRTKDGGATWKDISPRPN